MTHGHEVHVIHPQDAHRVKLVDLDMDYLVRAEDTSAGIAVQTWSLPGKSIGAPPHVHLHDDEIFFVLEGELTVMEEGTVTTAHPGTTVVLPRGRLHTFWNATDEPVKALVILAPGALEGYFEESSKIFVPGAPLDVAAVNRVGQKYGLQLRMDLMPQIMQQYGLQTSLTPAMPPKAEG